MADAPITTADATNLSQPVLFLIETSAPLDAAARKVRNEIRDSATPEAWRNITEALGVPRQTVVGILQPCGEKNLSLTYLASHPKLSGHAIDRLHDACERMQVLGTEPLHLLINASPGHSAAAARTIRHWYKVAPNANPSPGSGMDESGITYTGTIGPPAEKPVRVWTRELGRIALNIAGAMGYTDIHRPNALDAIASAARMHIWIGDLHLHAQRIVLAPGGKPINGVPVDAIAAISAAIEIPRRRAWFNITVIGALRLDPATDTEITPYLADLHGSLIATRIEYALHATPPIPNDEANQLLNDALGAAFADAPVKFHRGQPRKMLDCGYPIAGASVNEITNLCATLVAGEGAMDGPVAVLTHRLDAVTDRATRAESVLATTAARHADQIRTLEESHSAQVEALKAAIERERNRITAAPPTLQPRAPEPSADAIASLRGQSQHWRLRLEQLAQASRNIRDERDELRGEVWRLRQALRTKENNTTAAPPGTGSHMPLERLDLLGDWCKANLSPATAITRRALNAAAKSVFNDPERIGRCLLALDTLYAPMLFDNDPDARAAWEQFLLDEAVECGPVGAAVDDHRTWDTYRVTHNGRRLELDRHIQGNGGTRDKTRQFRIYFATDTANRVLVIGHLPEHLPNRMT